MKFQNCFLWIICLSFNSVFAGMIKLQWSCYLCSNEIGTVPLSLKAADSSPGPIGNKQTESLAHLPLFVSVYLSYLSWRHRVKSPPLTFPLEWPSPVPATPHWTERALTPIRTTLSEMRLHLGAEIIIKELIYPTSSNNDFFGPRWRIRTETTFKETENSSRLLNHVDILILGPKLPLFKHKARVYTLKMNLGSMDPFT